VTLKPGQTVSIRELQSSIKNLFATGNFRDIRVDAARNANGRRADVLALPALPRRRDRDRRTERADRTRAQRELSVHVGEILSLNTSMKARPRSKSCCTRPAISKRPSIRRRTSIARATAPTSRSHVTPGTAGQSR
jgi:hypothetical protein